MNACRSTGIPGDTGEDEEELCGTGNATIVLSLWRISSSRVLINSSNLSKESRSSSSGIRWRFLKLRSRVASQYSKWCNKDLMVYGLYFCLLSSLLNLQPPGNLLQKPIE